MKVIEIKPPLRHRLPPERRAVIRKMRIGSFKCYVQVGLYEDGRPGELFLDIAKSGSTISGFADSWAKEISRSLQNGVPLGDIVRMYRGVRFEPMGPTNVPEVPEADSIVDLIVRWLELKFAASFSTQHAA